MKDIPAIVEELRNCDAYNPHQNQKEHTSRDEGTYKKKNKDSLTIDDTLDDLWFDMWKVL